MFISMLLIYTGSWCMASVGRSVWGLQQKINDVVISRETYTRIIRVVEESYPIEACGVLGGYVRGSRAYAVRIAKLRNILGSTKNFWFDVKEWMDSILNIRRDGYEYIGIFHSHSGGAPIPSMSDQERMIECPEEIWLIISYVPEKDASLSAWRIEDTGLGLSKLRVAFK